MELTLRKEVRLILSQQMRQSMELLQMNTQELEAYLRELASENPMLEAKPPKESLERPLYSVNSGRRIKTEGTAADVGDMLRPVLNYESIADLVREQIAGLRVPALLRRELEYLVGELDDKGYLPEDSGSLAVFCGSEQRYENAVKVIQSLEPAGIGARGLSECLCIQLGRLGIEDELPYKICEKYLERIAKGQLNHIAKELEVPLRAVAEAKELISSLEPRPSNGCADGADIPYVLPDAEVVKGESGLEVVTADRYTPTYGVDRYYAAMSEREELRDDERDYFTDKLRQAKWAINCVTRRNDMLLACVRAVVETQRDFFEDGTSPIVPLTMTSLADRLAVHPSTISRAVKGKYLSCRWGMYPLSAFFAQELPGSDGGTGRDLLAGIRILIAEENPEHPLSDREIAERLVAGGIDISRRTVAKYREEAMIPSAPGRRTRKNA
ncbi:MAG: RNA polymerase factor sigma-54 [Oscillospiraceae bacterium]